MWRLGQYCFGGQGRRSQKIEKLLSAAILWKGGSFSDPSKTPLTEEGSRWRSNGRREGVDNKLFSDRQRHEVLDLNIPRALLRLLKIPSCSRGGPGEGATGLMLSGLMAKK
jgi:hypothetical protein